MRDNEQTCTIVCFSVCANVYQCVDLRMYAKTCICIPYISETCDYVHAANWLCQSVFDLEHNSQTDKTSKSGTNKTYLDSGY